MHLHVEEQGSGSDVCVLLHGMMGSSQSWWRLVPELVTAGYRVIAVDLPGHGLSDRDPSLTVSRAAAAVIDAVTQRTEQRPAVAIGHSFGGLFLAAAAPQLLPNLAIYVDAPLSSRGGHDFAEVVGEYEDDRRQRTAAKLRATRAHYSDRDCEVEALAADQFDPVTAAAVASAGGGSWEPKAGSIMVRGAPSAYVSDEKAAALKLRGVLVRSIPGAAHSVWYSHFDEFRAALPEVFR